MSIDRTRIKARYLDRERARHWPGIDELELLINSTTTGYRAIESIFEGWDAERVSDPTREGDFLNVKIAETDAELDSLFAVRLTHVKFDGKGYKIDGVEKPLGLLRVWIIHCLPTVVELNGGSALIAQDGSYLLTQAGGRLRAHG